MSYGVAQRGWHIFVSWRLFGALAAPAGSLSAWALASGTCLRRRRTRSVPSESCSHAPPLVGGGDAGDYVDGRPGAGRSSLTAR